VVALCAATLAAAALCACGGRPGAVEGRAVAAGRPVAGATAEAYLTGDRQGGSPPFATALSGADGAFRLALPAGSYWIWVRDLAAVAGPRRIGEYAGNPVVLASRARLALGEIELRSAGRADEAAAPGAGFRGRALHGGSPVEAAAVTVYGAGRSGLTGPGYAALVRSDAEGRFQVDLAPGEYRLAVRKRQGGAVTGFLREGDLSAVPFADPVRIEAGSYLELGDVDLHEVDRERLAAEAARGHQGVSDTTVEGVATAPDGKPRPAQFVFVYQDEGMIGRPEAVTTTDAAGAFRLALPAGGTYYFGARSRYGGPRQPGEWVGRLAGRPDSSLEVAAGRPVRGLVIVMEQVW
jgi:hypothetical protein